MLVIMGFFCLERDCAPCTQERRISYRDTPRKFQNYFSPFYPTSLIKLQQQEAAAAPSFLRLLLCSYLYSQHVCFISERLRELLMSSIQMALPVQYVGMADIPPGNVYRQQVNKTRQQQAADETRWLFKMFIPMWHALYY